MTSSFAMKLRVSLAGLACAVTLCATTGIASAQPGDGPLIETTCNYSQIVAALQVEAPDLAAKLADNPQAQTKLQAFIALPIDKRKQRLQQKLDENPQWRATIEDKQNTPEGQQKVQMLARIAATCHNY
jgi:hemophore-related protein